MAIVKIALTGGIACGKSSVGQIFKKMGATIIDLDQLAREVVKPNTESLKELVAIFGTAILNTDKTLNRKKLRQQLFANPANQQLIEKILHPKILARMHAQIKHLDAKQVIVDVPLLVEQNLWSLFNRTIVVDCSVQNQIKRLIERENISKALAQKMILAQADRKQRLDLANHLPTDVIENNADFSSLEEKTQKLWQKLAQL